MQIPLNDLQAFFTLLTPRIQRDLSLWYGSEARLEGQPTFHPRPWSYFFRYRIVNGKEEKNLLAKIRHIENMDIFAAMKHPGMREEMKDEFEALVKLREIFSHPIDVERYATIRDLAFYEDLNILVMEEADIRTLKSRFQEPQMWVEGSARKAFDVHLELTGGWLRIFHDRIGEVHEGPFFTEPLYRKAQVHLERIRRASGMDVKLIYTKLDEWFAQYHDQSLPYCMTHDNFSLSNVFVTGGEKICSFDPHNKPGAIYLDIAKLITDMETCSIQVATYGTSVPLSRLEGFNASFLRGYFHSDQADPHALTLYRTIHLLEKWDENEEKLADSTGAKKTLYGLAAIPMRRYFLKLLHRRISRISIS